METTPTKSIFELELNEEGKTHFAGIAQWCYFSAIASLLSLAVSVVSAVWIISKLGEDESAIVASTATSTLFSIIISLLLNITLLTSANNLKKGLAGADQGTFNLGMAKLATYFRILGIMMIIALVIGVLAIIVVLLAGASQGFK
jgi:hypothetical protein